MKDPSRTRWKITSAFELQRWQFRSHGRGDKWETGRGMRATVCVLKGTGARTVAVVAPTGIRWRMPNGKIENVAKTGSPRRFLKASIIDFCDCDWEWERGLGVGLRLWLPWHLPRNCLLTLGFLLRDILLPPQKAKSLNCDPIQS